MNHEVAPLDASQLRLSGLQVGAMGTSMPVHSRQAFIVGPLLYYSKLGTQENLPRQQCELAAVQLQGKETGQPPLFAAGHGAPAAEMQ